MRLRNIIRLKNLTPVRSITALLMAVIVVVAILEVTNTTHLFHKAKISRGTIPSTSIKTGQSSIKAVENKTGGTSSSSGATASQTVTGPLSAPSGTFVSNHYPGKNGAPYSEESVCNTTPGATCYIQFTKGSDIKTLATQTTNDSGVAAWSWSISQAGLSSGSWQVSAVAGANGQTKTTTDPIALEVP